MSDMSVNETDRIAAEGEAKSLPFKRDGSHTPTKRLAQMAITLIRPHAPIGMRFK